jgi:hypothetical protein
MWRSGGNVRPEQCQLHGEADPDKIGASILQIAIDEAWTGR